MYEQILEHVGSGHIKPRSSYTVDSIDKLRPGQMDTGDIRVVSVEDTTGVILTYKLSSESTALPSSMYQEIFDQIKNEELTLDAIPSNALDDIAKGIRAYAIPSNLYDKIVEKYGADAIPSNAIPSNAIPSNAIPSNLIERIEGALGSDAIPSNLFDLTSFSGYDAAAIPSN
jgi:hypothetical protein